MLLKTYEPKVVLPPCDYTRETVNAVADISDDISPVLPYLNAIMPGALYDPDAQILRFRWAGHMVTLQRDQIAMSGFTDGDAAILGLARLQHLINDTWERRVDLQPSLVQRKRLNPMAIYQLLPRTNCRQCGQPSCFVFATRVSVGEANLQECPSLQTNEHAEARQKLLAMLEMAT